MGSSTRSFILEGREIKLENTDDTLIEHDIKDNILGGGCRGCFRIDNLKKMTETYYHEGKAEIYADMLMACFSMKLDEIHGEDDIDLCFICEVCIRKLRDANEFKQQLETAQGAFKSLLDEKPKVSFTYEEGIDNTEEISHEKPVLNLHKTDAKQIITESFQHAIERISRKTTRLSRTKLAHRPNKSRTHLSALHSENVAENTLHLKKTLIRRQKSRKHIEAMPVLSKDSELQSEHISNILYNGSTPDSSLNLRKELVHRRKVKRRVKTVHPFQIGEWESQCNQGRISEVNTLGNELLLDQNDKRQAEALPFELDESELQCKICKEVFVTHRGLKMHMSIHYPNHVCEICGYLSLTQKKAESHATTHRPASFRCSLCPDKIYKDSGALRSHTRTKHLGVLDKYKCPLCDERFKNFNWRRKHLVEMHNDKDRKYACKLCDKTFNLGGTLSKHVRSVHLKERNFQCSLCSHEFFTRMQMANHMLSHSADRRFPCQQCQKRFKRKTALTQHIKIHTGEKKHVCNVCGRAFTQGCTLRGHMRVHERQTKI